MISVEQILWDCVFGPWIDYEVVIGEAWSEAAAACCDLDDLLSVESSESEADGIVCAREVTVEHLRDNDSSANAVKQECVRAAVLS